MKLRVIFEVDSNELFDMLHKQGGDTESIGRHLVEQLLIIQEPGLGDRVALALYGIHVQRKEFIPSVEKSRSAGGPLAGDAGNSADSREPDGVCRENDDIRAVGRTPEI